jgi:hypothetical protein
LEVPLPSLHAAVVFLAACMVGTVMGGLVFLHDKSVSAAVAAGALAAGGWRLAAAFRCCTG